MRSRLVRGVSFMLAFVVVVPMFLVTMFAPFSLAQSQDAESTPDFSETVDEPSLAAGDRLFTSDGIDSRMIAKADIDLASIPGPTLRLERISLPVGSALPSHTSVASEILYVSTGAITIADGFGFSTETSVGGQLAFNPGTSYELAQSGDVATEVLRLRVAASNDLQIPVETTESGDATPSAVAAIAEAVIATLVDYDLSDVGDPDVTIYLAQASFAPGAVGNEVTHGGPLGVYVESGALNALSPSGVVGTLAEGAGAVLPSSVPLVASNPGDAETVIFLAGIGEQGEPPLVEITPTPIPTIPPTATATLPPTNTPIPSATLEPSNTPLPSPTPEPTATSTPRLTPTPVPTTELGMTLALGKTWISDDGSITTNVVADDWSGNIAVSVKYTNLSGQRQDFASSASTITVFDDQGYFWNISSSSNDVPARVIVEAGETVEFVREFESPEGSNYVANVLVAASRFGGVLVAQWGFTINQAQVLDSPATGMNPTDGTVPVDLEPFLPIASELPASLEGPSPLVNRTVEWLSHAYTDAAAAEAQFVDLGWIGNTYANYEVAGGWQNAERGTINQVTVSIYEYSTTEGATGALDVVAADSAIDGWAESGKYDYLGATVYKATFEAEDQSSGRRVMAVVDNYLVIVNGWADDADASPAAVAAFEQIVERIQSAS